MPHLPLTLVYRQKFILDSLKESAATKQKIADECVSEIIKAIDIIIEAFNRKKKILLCGTAEAPQTPNTWRPSLLSG